MRENRPDTANNDTFDDCRACCGTGCRLGPDGCNGRLHPFIGCSTCIACNGSGLARQNGRSDR